MLTKISALTIAALILGSATGASAQSLIGDGLPAEAGAYGPYGTYAPAPYAYAPAQRQFVAPRHVRTHRRATEY
jgi:hypothetical protein